MKTAQKANAVMIGDNRSLKKMYDQFNAEFFDGELPDDARVEWSKRMTRAAGICYSRPHDPVIRLSVWYHRKHHDEIPATLLHEMIHMRAAVKGPNGKYANHGAAFKREAARLTAASPYHVKKNSRERAKTGKYTIRCTECSYEFTQDFFKIPQERWVERYSCGRCRGRFEIHRTGEEG